MGVETSRSEGEARPAFCLHSRAQDEEWFKGYKSGVFTFVRLDATHAVFKSKEVNEIKVTCAGTESHTELGQKLCKAHDRVKKKASVQPPPPTH